MTAPTTEGDIPPSLRRRGPVRFDLNLRTGHCPSMGRGRVHIRAGRTLVVRVIPPKPGTKVEISPEPPLLTAVHIYPVEGGAATTYHAEFIGHTSLRLSPLPTTARLRVVVVDGLPNPCRLTIPIAIWPSVWTLVLWWLLIYGGIVWLRWQDALAHSASVWDVFPQLGDDLPYLLQLLLLGLVVLVPLRAIGWLTTLADPGGDES